LSPRALITTADDFGASPQVNEAVLRAFQEGVLRFASLMADGPAAADAAAKARLHPGLGVGVHLVLCPASPAAWGLRLLRDRQARRQVEGLMAAQIERCLALGLVLTHLDSHWNAHVHPAVFPAVLRLARRYGIGRIRWPAGELGPSLAYAAGAPGRGLNPASLLSQTALACIYGALGLALKRRAQGISLPPAFGMLRSGMMTEDYVVWLLRRLPEGATEIYFHPSADPGAAAGDRPTPTHQNRAELLTLLSPRVRRVLQEERIELLSAR